MSLESLVEAVKFEAARHDIPWCLTSTTACILRPSCAPCAGFSSVMFDGSTLSYEENIRQTRKW